MQPIVLFVDADADAVGGRLFNSLQRSMPAARIERVNHIENLKSRMQQPVRSGRGDLYVLLADTPARLQQLASIPDFFIDRYAVLILPDSKNRTLADAHRLRPRFVGFVDDDFEHLCAVVRKMIGFEAASSV